MNLTKNLSAKQRDLQAAIQRQRGIVRAFPEDITERVLLDTLVASLRETFYVVPQSPTPQYVLSPSRAILKRVFPHFPTK